MASKAQKYQRAAWGLDDIKPVFRFLGSNNTVMSVAVVTEDGDLEIRDQGRRVWFASGAHMADFAKWITDTFVDDFDEEEEPAEDE